VAIAEEHTRGPSLPVLDMPRDILVVDDDRDIRETLGEILNHEGYHVEMAENGARAIELIRRGPAPSLVLLDLMMPVMSGWEFLEQAETDETLHDIPVLVVSAMPAPLAPPESRGGVKACLHKPLKLEQLLDLVHQYADHSNG
jgi:two-component system, OmpR family, response regulator CpxR